MESFVTNDRLVLELARYPIELQPPADFEPADPATWPRIDGCLEYVDGRLLYMPPCGDLQMDVVGAIPLELADWLRSHPQFTYASGEAGMMFEGEVRGADGAIWRRAELAPRTGGYREVAPVLAIEVAGRYEGEEKLREKATWYFEHGVEVVWIVLPRAREVVVLTPDKDLRCGRGTALPPHESLPDLSPAVDGFFAQLD